MDEHYSPREIEPKWQRRWEEQEVYLTPEDRALEDLTTLDDLIR